jgi:hypothetical protein
VIEGVSIISLYAVPTEEKTRVFPMAPAVPRTQ